VVLAVPSSVGGLEACPEKKNQFCAKNYAILSKFWYFFPILQQKVGGLSPSAECGGPFPLPTPCYDVYGLMHLSLNNVDALVTS